MKQQILFIFLICLFTKALPINNSKPKLFNGYFILNDNIVEDTIIKYISNNNFGRILTSSRGIFYQFVKPKSSQNYHRLSEGDEAIAGNFDILNLKQVFFNSNFSAATSIEPTFASSNFFIGDSTNWHTNVPNFNGLHFKEIYDHIDLKLYSAENTIKYDLILKPGWRQEDLKTSYEGADSIVLGEEGKSILIYSKYGIIKETTPEVYQIINGKKIPINCEYHINSDTISYKIYNYDLTSDVIIDPTLIYASYFGSTGDDYFLIGDAAVDPTGNVYTTGSSNNLNFPVTPGAYSTTYAGGLTDIFVLKCDPNGVLLVSTFIGGNDYDFGFGIDIDVNGNTILGGDAWSGNFPTTAGVYQAVHSTLASTNGDITVTRFNPGLNTIINSTFIGGVNDEQPHEIIAGSNGNIYLGGQAKSGMPTTAGAYQGNCAGDYDYFGSILNSNFSTLIASSYVGGSSRDRGNGIAIDNNFNLYITGYVEGTFPTTAGAFDVSYSGGTSDITVVKFNATLTALIYSTYIGGNNADLAQNIELLNNEAIIIGSTNSSNYPTTPGCYSSATSGLSDVSITKLNANGSGLVNSTLIGSSGVDQGWNLCISPTGDVGVTGHCANNFPTTTCAYDNTYNGGLNDAFIAIFNANFSTLLYSSYYGGSGDEAGRIIFIDASKQYLFGNSTSSDLSLAGSSFDNSYNGTRDIFLSIFNQTSSSPTSFSYSNACNNLPINFTSNSGTLNANWNFGDPASGSNNTSTLLNPSHLFSSPGNYTVTSIINTTCGTDTLTQTVMVGLSLTAVASPDTTICSGTNLLLTVAGGINYTWNNGISSTNDSILVTPSINTQYIVNILDSACTSIPDTINVIVLPLSTVTISGDSTICLGDSLTLIGLSNTNNINWSGAVNSINDTVVFAPLSSTTVYLENTGSNCNIAIDSLFITVLSPAIITAFPDTTVCEGTNILLTVSGGSSYVWNNGISSNNDSVNVNLNVSTQYIVYAQEQGCTSLADTINVNVLPLTSVTIIGDSAICSGDTLVLVATGNVSNFQWSGPLISTNDTLTFIPSNSDMIYLQGPTSMCSTPVDSLYLTVNSPTITTSIPDTTVCAGTNLQLTAIGGSSFVWNNGVSSNNDTIEVMVNNSVQYTVYAQNPGCTVIADTINIIATPAPNVNILGNPYTCSGNNVMFIANGNASNYQWFGSVNSNNDTISFTAINNGVIYLQGSDGNCLSPLDSISIIVENQPVANFTYSNTLCANSSVNFTSQANLATSYYWNFGDSVSNPYYFSFQPNPIHNFLTAGNYSVMFVASNNCGSDTALQNIQINSGPNANLPLDTSICLGQSLSLVANGGTQYIWSGAINSNNDTITLNPISNCIITLTISNGICFGLTDTMLIEINYPAEIDIVKDNNIYCPGDSVKLYANGGADVYWDIFGTIYNDNPLTISPASGGFIFASNLYSNCPLSKDSMFINMANRSIANFTLDVDSCLNKVQLVNLSEGASTYHWQVVDLMNSELPSPDFIIKSFQEYEIILITNPESNCADTAYQKMFLGENYGNYYFIPNTFTPNSDGLNNEFKITTANQCKYFKLFIYNRWGNLLHFTEGTEVKWDAIFRGADVPQGVYVYLLQVDQVEQTGTITVFR